MAHAPETLEHAEHIAHAGHGHDGQSNTLAMSVGITMAMLGVLLAFASARVGYERTELVQYLVEQQHAHAKYQAQDIKHRVALLSLQQMHAFTDDSKVKAEDLTAVARSANRYFAEAQAAKAWVDAYDAVVAAHSEAQEEYEHAQLAAELAIVIASIALLLRKKLPWGTAIVLGLASVVMLTITWRHTSHQLHEAEAKVSESEKVYRSLRESGKTTDADQALVDQVLKAAGEPAAKEGLR